MPRPVAIRLLPVRASRPIFGAMARSLSLRNGLGLLLLILLVGAVLALRLFMR